MWKKSIYNIPNLLSLYRLCIFPVVLIFGILGYEQLFVILLCISLATDILDGLIARVFDMKTEIGARLDSVADLGTFILGFYGMFQFKYLDIQSHLFSLFTFIGLFLLCYLIPLMRYKRFPSYHLFSWKIGGYIQGIFLFVLFVFGFNVIFYYFTIIFGIISFLEHLTIQIITKGLRSNLKGLYWVLKEQTNEH